MNNHQQPQCHIRPLSSSHTYRILEASKLNGGMNGGLGFSPPAGTGPLLYVWRFVLLGTVKKVRSPAGTYQYERLWWTRVATVAEAQPISEALTYKEGWRFNYGIIRYGVTLQLLKACSRSTIGNLSHIHGSPRPMCLHTTPQPPAMYYNKKPMTKIHWECRW